MLATKFTDAIKTSFHFKNERLTEKLQAVRCHILCLFLYHLQFIKTFLDNKMSIFEEYGAFSLLHKSVFFMLNNKIFLIFNITWWKFHGW